MTTLSDRLAYPDVKITVLAEVQAGQHLKFWSLTASQTYTYEATTPHRVSDVRENGASLTSRASVALVEANAGSYYWDQTAGKVHVHPTGSVSPYAKTIQALVSFRFSTRSRVVNGLYYDGRIKSLPSLSMRIEAVFGDPGQIGGGTLVLHNEDGFFDDLGDLEWDAGQVDLKVGADDPLLSI